MELERKYSNVEKIVQEKENKEIVELSNYLDHRTPKETRFSKLYLDYKKGEEMLRKLEK